jgi:Prokaryotic E2 family E
MPGAELLKAHLGELCERIGASGRVEEAGDRLFVVLDRLALPPGVFNREHSDVLFIAERNYPFAAMDMFWVEPDLLRADGAVPANADSVETYLGREWRRFSWHRQGVWRITGNPLLDHYALMEARFAIEPREQAA